MPYSKEKRQTPEVKAKERAAYERWKKKYPEKYRRVGRNANYKKNFGITLEQYEQMFEAQQGLCAICQKPEKHFDRKVAGRLLSLAVDHDHATNKIRALLCMDCNKGIGCFGEDIPRMLAAIEYIKKHTAGHN